MGQIGIFSQKWTRLRTAVDATGFGIYQKSLRPASIWRSAQPVALALWLAASSYHHSQLPLAPLGTDRYWTRHDYHLQSPTLITLVYRLASGVFAFLYFRQRH